MAHGMPLEFDRDEFARRWNGGESIAEMAEWLDCSPTVVEEQVAKLGLTPRKFSMAVTVDIPTLFRLWRTDLTRREIALQMGIREGYLNKLAVKHKLPPRGQRERKSGKVKVDPFLMPAEEYERRKAEVKAMSMARKRLERYQPKDI